MKLIFPLILVLLFSCKLDSDKQIDRKKFTFKTGSDTQIFFKNVRQTDYDLEEHEAAKFNVFRHTKRDTAAPINLAIVINYLNDEAYLLLELSDGFENLPLIVNSQNDTTNVIEPIELSEQNRESMLEFATEIYEGLLSNNQFSVVRNGKSMPVLESNKQREAFRITVADYYRLTRIY